MSRTMIAVCGFLLLAGCAPDAQHDNALDPASSQYSPAGSLSGRITGKKQPAAGIPSALITLLPSNVATTSDSTGFFSFSRITPGVLTLAVQKTGFLSDTININVPSGSSTQQTIPLDQYPVVTATKVLAQKIDQWWPGPVYSAACTAVVSDPDGDSDIDSVWLNVGTIQFPMEYSLTARSFQLVLFAEQLPSNNLEWLVGKALTISSRAHSNALTRSEPFYISRIIEQEGTPVYPSSQDTLTGAPEFRWTPPSVAFTYTYTVTVVRTDAGVQTVVATQKQIDPYQYSWQATQTFAPGTYFWTLAVVDEFGNVSQSKPSSFFCR
jgi:hypothetical protein